MIGDWIGLRLATRSRLHSRVAKEHQQVASSSKLRVDGTSRACLINYCVCVYLNLSLADRKAVKGVGNWDLRII
jgi:hypothetical protein